MSSAGVKGQLYNELLYNMINDVKYIFYICISSLLIVNIELRDDKI